MYIEYFFVRLRIQVYLYGPIWIFTHSIVCVFCEMSFLRAAKKCRLVVRKWIKINSQVTAVCRCFVAAPCVIRISEHSQRIPGNMSDFILWYDSMNFIFGAGHLYALNAFISDFVLIRWLIKSNQIAFDLNSIGQTIFCAIV